MTDQDLLKEVVALAMRLGHVERERDEALRAAESAADALKNSTDVLIKKNDELVNAEQRIVDLGKEVHETRNLLQSHVVQIQGLIVDADNYRNNIRPARRRTLTEIDVDLAGSILNAKTFLLSQRPF